MYISIDTSIFLKVARNVLFILSPVENHRFLLRNLVINGLFLSDRIYWIYWIFFSFSQFPEETEKDAPVK